MPASVSPSGFNEAAPLGARKGHRMGLGGAIRRCFNEAAPLGARKGTGGRLALRQADRGFNEAAPLGARKARSDRSILGDHYAASMRPRLWGRGRDRFRRVAIMERAASMRPRLWGRGRNTACSAGTVPRSASMRPRLWGHGRMTALAQNVQGSTWLQ